MTTNAPTDNEKQQVHLGMFRRLYRNKRTGKLHLGAAERRMGLKPGDIVFRPDDPVERSLKERMRERWGSLVGEFPREFEVSSIREDGQFYFKRGTEQAPARYLEKRTAPEETEEPNVQTDEREVR